jgi:hypothetical protein
MRSAVRAYRSRHYLSMQLNVWRAAEEHGMTMGAALRTRPQAQAPDRRRIDFLRSADPPANRLRSFPRGPRLQAGRLLEGDRERQPAVKRNRLSRDFNWTILTGSHDLDEFRGELRHGAAPFNGSSHQCAVRGVIFCSLHEPARLIQSKQLSPERFQRFFTQAGGIPFSICCELD